MRLGIGKPWHNAKVIAGPRVATGELATVRATVTGAVGIGVDVARHDANGNASAGCRPVPECRRLTGTGSSCRPYRYCR